MEPERGWASSRPALVDALSLFQADRLRILLKISSGDSSGDAKHPIQIQSAHVEQSGWSGLTTKRRPL